MFVGLVLFFFIYVNKKEKDTRLVETKASITTSELLSHIDNNNTDYLKKYIDKAIEVEGELKELTYKNNTYSLLLTCDNSDRLVLCEMQKDEADKVENLKIGTSVKLKGIYKGSLLDAILLNCIFIK